MKDITSLRGTLEFLKERGELLTVTKEVDPILEIAGIQKALDNGPALLFENIKGYPEVRDVGNILSREETTAAMFGLDSIKELETKLQRAIPVGASILDPDWYAEDYSKISPEQWEELVWQAFPEEVKEKIIKAVKNTRVVTLW